MSSNTPFPPPPTPTQDPNLPQTPFGTEPPYASQPAFPGQPYPGQQPYAGQPYPVQPAFPGQPPYPATYPTATADFPGKVRLVGILFAILGGLAALFILGVMVFIPVVAHSATPNGNNGTVTQNSDETTPPVSTDTGSPGASAAATRTGFAVMEFFLAIGLLFGAGLPLLASYGLLTRKPWGRTLALVDSFLILLSFPFGTALGGYTLYLLLQSGAREGYAQLAATPNR